MNKDKIDFVIVWVDGNDINWQKERKKYENNTEGDNSLKRYRDWENLQFLFRGIEKFTPWVNKIHFVTYGHLPKWLNINHPKLNIVEHKDFIPKEYLPTFSSHTIEINLHRIKGLAEKFVYFNDDIFILKKMGKNDFFIREKPCDSAILTIHCYDISRLFIMAHIRDIGIINKHFNFRKVIFRNLFKWFNIKYGIKNNLINAFLLLCPRFPGLYQQHLATSFLKSTFIEVWEKESKILHETCKNKFRMVSDVNQWLFKDWQIVKGNFYPRSLRVGKSIELKNVNLAYNYIVNQKIKLFCINDSDLNETEYKIIKSKIIEAFNEILPNKSQFEE